MTSPIVLELGCGKGEYTLLALRGEIQIKTLLVLISRGLAFGVELKRHWKKVLENVAFLRTQIELVDRLFAENESV